jgi:hypothetical protein
MTEFLVMIDAPDKSDSAVAIGSKTR